ncbi:hypothetical protein VFC49_06630 [Thermococcus sp. SY098]|uniref:hypothetical protein n=1 Tax=Thermococcus sp. SY098 TaxID=3111325 RepID=UPI002D794CE2|nr:hypothetical protein [Thermococcus sp. SY098]WRS53730.1 hypothetical protein VFC49_06630 [Thermococcus sp. SY098]
MSLKKRKVKYLKTKNLIKFTKDDVEITVFKNGKILIRGTNDKEEIKRIISEFGLLRGD